MCPAVSKAQQQAMGIAYAAKKEGKSPEEGTASAQMAKMSQDELKKFAKTKHAGLPRRVHKKKRAKKVSEAFGQKLDTYIQIIDRWLESQEFNDMEIDTILNDPDNMDMIENGEAHGINPIIIAQDLKTEELLVGQVAQMHESQKFVSESINEFLSHSRGNTYENEADGTEMETDRDLEFAADIFFNEYLPSKGQFSDHNLNLSGSEALDNIVADFTTYLEQNYYKDYNPKFIKTLYKEIVQEYLKDPRFAQETLEPR